MPTTKANTAPGCAAVTTAVVFQTTLRRLRPVKRAPTAGPVTPSSHCPPSFSGLHSPIRPMSVTRSYTAVAGAMIRLLARNSIITGSFPCVKGARERVQ